MNNSTTKLRRRRAILSCNDCRRRKLKCDRLDPCNRCIQGGIAGSCAYGPEAHIKPSQGETEHSSKRACRSSTRANGNPAMEPHTLHNLSHVRSQIALADPIHEPEPKDTVEFLAQSPNLKAVDPQGALMGLLKGRSYGTFYYGSSAAMSVIAIFPELRNFMKLVYSTSTARRLSQDMRRLEDQARAMKPFNRVLSIMTLRSLLPDRSTVDVLVQKYLNTFENTLRILHIPMFEKDYKSYWDRDHNIESDMDAIVLMILACAICTSTHETPRYMHNGSSFHSKAALWIRACEVWLKRQSNKHKTLANLQVRCLRLLALATSSLKVKEYYQEVQMHLAVMRSCGMHRDPSIFGTRCSVFEGEMRRRLWATSMELELQASFDKGIASMLSNHDYDCAPPRNIDDTELAVDAQRLPSSKNENIFTDTSFLHCSMQSVDLRVELCSLANNFKRIPDNHALLDAEAVIWQQLRSVPQWANQDSVPVQTVLKLQLKQFIVVLFASKALSSNLAVDSGSRYFAIAALEAAESTIDLHLQIVERSNYALCMTRIDYFRAALIIARLTFSSLELQDNVLTKLTKAIFEASMHKALFIQEERAMRPGRGTEYLWYLAAATSLVGLKMDPSQADKLKRQASDRIEKVLYKQLSLLDEPSTESLATEILLRDAPNTGMNLSPAITTTTQDCPSVESPNAMGLGFDALDMGDSSESWFFDDYWFFNDVLGGQLNADLQPTFY